MVSRVEARVEIVRVRRVRRLNGIFILLLLVFVTLRLGKELEGSEGGRRRKDGRKRR